MATIENEIINRFTLDFDQYKSQLNELKGGTKELGTQTVQAQTKIQSSIKATGEAIEKNSQSTKAFAKQMQSAQADINKAYQANIKSSNQLADETNNVATAAKSLKQQYREALKEAQNGSDAALKKAAQLKDQIDDTNESIKNLASGSKLEQFGNTLGSVTSKIANLDFGDAKEQADQLAQISSKITFKDALGGVKDLGSSLLKVGQALVTNPLFLIGGAVAGIVYEVYKWITAESALEKQIRQSREAEEIRFAASSAFYDRQIKLAKSLGEFTGELERKKLKNEIKNTEISVKLSTQEFEAKYGALRAYAKLQGKTLDELAAGDEEYHKKKTELIGLEKQLISLRTDLEASDNTRRKANEKSFTDALVSGVEKQGEAIKKGYEDREKYAKDAEEKRKARLEQQKKDAELEAQREQEILKLGEESNKEREKQEEEFNKASGQLVNDLLDQKEAARIIDQDAELKHLKEQTKFLKGNLEERQDLLDEAHEKGLISEEQYNDETKALAQQRQQIYLESARAGLNAFVSLFDSLALLDGQNSEFAKVGAIFRIAIDTAEALANTIKGATAAAAATGPAAPFVLGGYIAAGIAEVFGAFAQVTALVNKPVPKAQPSQVKRFAQGTPYVTGGTPGQDSVPALLMPGERVTDTATNIKYWEALEDIRTGKFADNYIHVSDMAPMLGAAISDSREMEQETSAINIANSLIGTGKWKGENIQRSLKALDKNESIRNQKLVNAITENKTRNLRKK